MSKWISKVTCAKYKRKGHLAFYCPPKYGNKLVKSSKFPKKKEPQKVESADHLKEFSRMVSHNYKQQKNYKYEMNYLFDKKKEFLTNFANWT